MPRIARIVAVGYPHHITQRGNYQQKIFSDDIDRKKYISYLKSEAIRYQLSILTYSLMTNHVHFIVVPEKEDSMAKVFKNAHMKYSQYYNRKKKTSGHLFQGRFFSSVMDEKHTIACARYIERNAVRAKMVMNPELWEWSSARVHCGFDEDEGDELGVNKLFDYIGYGKKEWREFVNMPDNVEEIKQIRGNTRKGRLLGDKNFIEKLEKKLNRILKLKSRGRPKKQL